MQVWVVWEHFCHSFDIIAEESLHIVGIFASEESAYVKVDEMTQKQEDPDISYYYEAHNVED